MGGLRFARSWQDSGILDFFDAKGMVENLSQRYGLNLIFEKGQDSSLHPSKQAAVFIEDKMIGLVGEVHPKCFQLLR